MSAELLRRAAALMRERAEAVPLPDGDASTATWLEEYGPTSDMNNLERAESEYIASWHPAVALAVADWLDHAANRAESKIEHGGKAEPVWSHERDALAVARAYLGAQS